MKERSVSGILKQYTANQKLYDECTVACENLIKELLKQYKLRVHSVTSRLKELESIRNKLHKTQEKYKNISDMTDICGIRIITYFSDEVDSVASMVEKEFDIDNEKSIDKRKILDPDQFGYLSVHYISKLNSDRLKLMEYRRFKNCVVEIQIRSILHHAWAEIEHDLGYKSEVSVPKEHRRRFSRLAGLLELADDEFIGLRKDLSAYESTVSAIISKSPASVAVNKASLISYISNSKIVSEMEEVINSKYHIKRADISTGDNIERLNFVGINTIEDIEKSLRKNKDLILQIADDLFVKDEDEDEDEGGEYPYGLPVFYLPYAILSNIGSIEKAYEFVDIFVEGSKKDQREFAKHLIAYSKESSS